MSSTSMDHLDNDGVHAKLSDAKTVLILAANKLDGEDACWSLLADVDPRDSRYIGVTLDETPDDKLAAWRANVGGLPSETGIIAVGETTRSTTAASSPKGPGGTPVSIDSVGDPSDLTGLAMAIGAYLDAWGDTKPAPVVCFDSVTSLLYHADESRVYRFIHSTTGRLREIGATAHFHLNPEVCDEGRINRFSGLFDAVLEIESDGSVTVRKRRVSA